LHPTIFGQQHNYSYTVKIIVRHISHAGSSSAGDGLYRQHRQQSVIQHHTSFKTLSFTNLTVTGSLVNLVWRHS